MKKIKLNAVLLAALASISAQAQVVGPNAETNFDTNLRAPSSVWILGNSDGIGDSEGVYIRSNGETAPGAGADFVTNGNANIFGTTTTINGTTTTINGTTTNVNARGNLTLTGNSDGVTDGEGVRIYSTSNGGASIILSSNADGTSRLAEIRGETRINGDTSVTGTLSASGATTLSSTLAVTGATTLSSTLGVTGLTTTNGITNNGALTQTGTTSLTGATTVTGATSINTTANAGNTSIGNTGNAVSITGSTNTMTATGLNTVSGANNNLTATQENTLSAANNTLTATAANSIQAPINNIGTTSASVNTMGNTNAATQVISRGGNASQTLQQGSANTLVTGGASGLTARTGMANTATSAQVLLSNAGGTTVDANGKILTTGDTGYVAPTAPTAALTLTNGYGNTHGLVVTESQTTLSGGTQSSSLTLNDRAATFSRASDGAPITVTGVANGSNDFDAVNVRQFAGAIAAVAAQANVPSLAAGQDRSVGLGVGNFMGKSALALGLNLRGSATSVYKLSLSSGLNGGAKPVVGAGAAWAF